MFFTEGGKTPKLLFYVTLSDVDKDATRFYLNIDGQSFDVAARAAESHRHPVEWPGSETGQRRRRISRMPLGGAERAKVNEGPWAWFQLIDDWLDQEGSDSACWRSRRSTTMARVTVESSSNTSNPLLVRDWQQFRCGS